MAAAVGKQPETLEALPARAQFRIQSQYSWVDYDVSPHGRILAVVPQIRANERPLTVLPHGLPPDAEARTRPSTERCERLLFTTSCCPERLRKGAATLERASH